MKSGRFFHAVSEARITSMKHIEELIWANIYHDSIRGNAELENLSLKVGRWAGNYSFLYALHRILKDFTPKKIVEFGLGESSKFISAYNHSTGNVHEHIIIEHDGEWGNFFKDTFPLKNYDIQIHPMEKKSVHGFEYNGFKDAEAIPTDGDFYLIDGPHGVPRFSRYEVVNVANRFEKGQEFIIMMDDFTRKGEHETALDLIKALKAKGFAIYFGTFKGVKTQIVVASEKYKFALSV